MPLVNMKDLLSDAQKGGYAVGSFSIANMEMILGVIKAAEETKSPIILQIAEVRLNHSPLAIIGPTMIAAAKNAKVPVAVHLDHGTTLECIKQALEIGFTSVMFDGSHLDVEENIAMTKKVIEMAKPYGAAVEAEIASLKAVLDRTVNVEEISDADLDALKSGKEKLMESVYLNYAAMTNTPINPKNWMYEENVALYGYNPSMASTFLKNSGWTDADKNGILEKKAENGQTKRLKVTILVNKENTARRQIASKLKEEIICRQL